MNKPFEVSELKHALVQVRDICAASWVDCVEKCPLFDHDAFGCPIQNTYPCNWDVDGWKERKHEAD